MAFSANHKFTPNFVSPLKIIHYLSPEALSNALPVFAPAQMAHVVQREKEAVPGGREPGESEGNIELFECYFG